MVDSPEHSFYSINNRVVVEPTFKYLIYFSMTPSNSAVNISLKCNFVKLIVPGKQRVDLDNEDPKVKSVEISILLLTGDCHG